MRNTRNSLKSNARKSSIELLNARLADSIDLALATKQAHWTLRGPTFIAIHEMLDVFRSNLDKHIDIIAERVAQLGGQAVGSTHHVAATSKLEPYPLTAVAIEDHLKALIERYGDCANAMRAAIDACDDEGDADTADIFTAASRELDRSLWMLEAHRAPD